MELHFENLSFGIIIFYAVAVVLLVGTWLIILKNIVKYIFKRELKILPAFIGLTIILFLAFIIITLFEPPNGFNH